MGVYIWWSDLSEGAQNELLEEFGSDYVKEMGWEGDEGPVAEVIKVD